MDSKNIQLWKDQLSEISKKIQGQQAEEWMTRGIIVTDNEALNFVKKELDYDTLKQLHKVCELDIDASWSQCMTITPEDNATGFWNKMVKTLNSCRDGLLVLNVTNIELFKLCWHLVQLVKDERGNELYAWCSDELFDPSRVKFTGYVLINASALNWDDACDYARDNNKGYFQAMLQVYSRVML